MNTINVYQKGVTIVELMIAMVLGLLVIAAVVQVFINNKEMYLVQESNARLQENGRYAIHTISEKIRKAGYLGCSTRSKGSSIANVVTGGTTNYLYDFQKPIQGSEATATNTWVPVLHSSIAGELTDTDVLTIRYIESQPYRISSHASAASDITIPTGNDFSEGDFAIASNCEFSTVFQITNSDPSTGTLEHKTSGVTPANASTSIIKSFQGGEVARVNTVSFYISDPDLNGIPSLYQVEFGGIPVEVVSGVDDLQIEYGVDNASADGAADVYQAANAVVDWLEVVSVRINLNLRSDDLSNLKVDSSSANDYFETQVFRTISLRNRVP